ncbi:MAG: sensor domain-containing diguanylate cyclase [Candidatus Gastranaerophilales bacterium]|nr:sensor domain-containing diguanylate cyclase [Candidatus Gastranaerophilales bacterium]
MTDKISFIENSLTELNKMFELSAIVSNAIGTADLISKFSGFLAEYLQSKNIHFFILEKGAFRNVATAETPFADKYFEYDNEAFFSVLSSDKIIKLTDNDNGKLFNGFLSQTGLADSKVQYMRAFFNREENLPVCFCFMGNETDEDKIAEGLKFLNRAFDYAEPVLIKLMAQKEQNKKIDDLQQSLYNVSILYNISQAVNFIDDLKRLLQVILSKATEILNAEKGSLMLYDYSTNTLQVKVVYGLSDKRVEENINSGLVQTSKIKVGEGIAGTVFLERKAIITNLGLNDPRFVAKNSLASVQSILCVPLIAKGDAIGVINISNKKDNMLFNQKDLEFMSSLANQAAIAIDNAKLYELATKDGLTKLYINRHFMTLLENEIRRCTRYKHNLSLIMIDIDDFKLVNDRHGHLAGDQILREVSNQILTTVRKIDVPARYGGEEFVIMLPETNKEGAAIIAERLRKNISSISITTNDEKVITATVSMGISQFPDHGQIPQDIIEKADKALYNSKRNGKNVVSIYTEDGFELVKKPE